MSGASWPASTCCPDALTFGSRSLLWICCTITPQSMRLQPGACCLLHALFAEIHNACILLGILYTLAIPCFALPWAFLCTTTKDLRTHFHTSYNASEPKHAHTVSYAMFIHKSKLPGARKECASCQELPCFRCSNTVTGAAATSQPSCQVPSV